MATAPPLQTAAPAALTDARVAGQELSDRAFLEAPGDDLLARRRAEVAELVRAAAWANRTGEPRNERDPMVTPGGDGTPSVREYAAAAEEPILAGATDQAVRVIPAADRVVTIVSHERVAPVTSLHDVVARSSGGSGRSRRRCPGEVSISTVRTPPAI